MLCIILSKLLGLLLGHHARAGATPLKWPTETAHVVAVDHLDGGLLIKYLFGTHQTKILLNRLYLIVYRLRIAHFRRSFKVGNAGRSCTVSDILNG